MVYVRRELAIIRPCATVTRNGFINDVVDGVKGSLCNASQSSSADAGKVDRPTTDWLNTDLNLDIGNGISWKR